MPRKSSINRNFWSDPHAVANDLFGKQMVVADIKVTIRKAKGFLRDQGMRPLYEPMLGMDVGEVYCPKLVRAILTVIVTLDRGQKGGRVLIEEIEHEGRVISGAGNVSKFLGIIESKKHGVTRWLDRETFQIDWDR